MQDVEVPAHDGVGAPSAAAVPAAPVLASLAARLRGRGEQRWVAQVALGAHDAVRARGREAPLQVAVLEDVAVGEEHGLRRQVVPQEPDHLPVGHAGDVALLLSPPPVDRQDAGARPQHVLRVREGRLLGVQDADLGRHGDGEVLVQRVYHVVDELLVLLQEGPVVALARDALRAPQVQVDGVAVGGCDCRGVEEMLGIVGAELNEEGAVDSRVAVEERLGFRGRPV